VSDCWYKRWGFLRPLDIGADDDPYLDRLRLVETPLFGLYLHHIHRADREEDPHDHPWWFASIVLCGVYEEIVWADKRDAGSHVVRHRPRWSLRHISRAGAHIITAIRGPLWTLVLVGPKRGEWGFWTARGFIPHDRYEYANGLEEGGRRG
jgi:hypothetical protein